MHMKDNSLQPISITELVNIGKTYRSLPPVLRKKIDILSRRVPLSQKKTLTIGVVGAFTRGKSSFINALLGIEILPTNLLPATAIPHVLVYGDELRIWSFQKKQKRIEEDITALTRYTALNSPNATEVLSILVEVPSSYLNRNLRIIDTPGIGAVFSDHYKISIQCIQECDLAIVILSSEPLISEVECQFIQEIRNKVGELVFVQTKIDREKNWSEKVQFNETVIRQRLGLSQAKIYPVSSDFLAQYRKNRLPKVYEASQFSSLEEKLELILKKDRRRLMDIKDKILIQTVAADLRKFLLKEIRQGNEKEKQLKARRQLWTGSEKISHQVRQQVKQNLLAAGRDSREFIESTHQEFLREFEAFVQIQELNTIQTMGQTVMNRYVENTREQIQRKVHQLRIERLARVLELVHREAGLKVVTKNLHHDLSPFQAAPIELENTVILKAKQNKSGTGLVVGATVGTLVLPLIGTAIGAVVGALVGNEMKSQEEIDLEATKNAIRAGTTTYIDSYFQMLTTHVQQETAEWMQSIVEQIEHGLRSEDEKRNRSLAKVEHDLSMCRRVLRFQESLLAKLMLFE